MTKTRKLLVQRITSVLLVYIKTQLLLVAAVTLISWGLLSFLGVSHAWLLAILTGSASIVPILGLTSAAIITALFAVFDGTTFLPQLPVIFEGIFIIILYGILNICMDYFLSPFLIGKSVHIHPMILLISVILGTLAFGFLGAFLTIPILLVLKTLSDEQ
jgi:predicted PurR-regulated permease PerM